MKHILLLGTGCPSDAGPVKEKLARDLAIQAPSKVLGDNADVDVLPNGFEDYRDPTKVSRKRIKARCSVTYIM